MLGARAFSCSSDFTARGSSWASFFDFRLNRRGLGSQPNCQERLGSLRRQTILSVRFPPIADIRCALHALREWLHATIAHEAIDAHHALMLNLLSLLVGAVALVLGIIAFFPLLGWAYWVIVPLALVGLGLGVVSRHKSGRNLNLVVIIVGVIRLMLGGGII